MGGKGLVGLGVLVNLHLDLNHQAAYQLEAAEVELVDEVELAEVAGDAPGAGIGGGVVILVLFFLVVVGKVVDVALAIVIDVVESYIVGGGELHLIEPCAMGDGLELLEGVLALIGILYGIRRVVFFCARSHCKA